LDIQALIEGEVEIGRADGSDDGSGKDLTEIFVTLLFHLPGGDILGNAGGTDRLSLLIEMGGIGNLFIEEVLSGALLVRISQETFLAPASISVNIFLKAGTSLGLMKGIRESGTFSIVSVAMPKRRELREGL
jgi:hypothetical protein